MNFVAWMIVACEIAFWVVIAAGLLARYVLKLPKLGLILLALTPVVDLVLLIITGLDLYRGSTATTAHAIAAVYIGISVAYGKSMIQWADTRFRYHIAKQPEAKPVKRYGTDFAKHYLKGFFRHILAFLIGVGLLAGLIYWIDDPARTEKLMGILRIWGAVLGIDFLITCSYFIWPKSAKS